MGYCEAHWGSLLFTIGSALLCLETYAPYYRRPGATSVAASLWWGSVVFLLSSLAFMAEDYRLWASGSASQLRSKEASDTLAHCLSYPGLTHAGPAFAALLPCMSPWAAPDQVWGNVIMLPGRVAFIHGSTSDECGMFLRPRLTRRAKAD